MKDYKRYLMVFCLLSLSANVSLSAETKGILSSEDAQVADADTLLAEVSLFKSILEGITLSVARCDKAQDCMPDASSGEVQQLMTTLDQRIESLGQRQQDADAEADLGAVLVAYVSEREGYSHFLEKLGSGSEHSPVVENIDESELFGNEEEKPVEIDKTFDVFSDEDEEL